MPRPPYLRISGADGLFERVHAAAEKAGLTMTDFCRVAIEARLSESEPLAPVARCPIGHTDCAVFVAMACRTCSHKPA